MCKIHDYKRFTETEVGFRKETQGIWKYKLMMDYRANSTDFP